MTQIGIRTALVYSLGQRYVAFLMQLAVTVVLARLLSPQETGVFSLAASAVAVGQLLREFGVSDYIFAQKDISREKLRRAFTVTLLLSWLIAVVLWLLAYAIAAWYREPGLETTIHWLCLNFLLVPFGSIATTLMARELKFGLLFWTQSSGTLVGGAVTLWLAWDGYSYLSMAIGSVASNLWSIGLLLGIQRRNVFVMPLLTGLGDVLRFGGGTISARLLEQVPLRGTDFVISAGLGFHATGIYSKASGLLGSFHDFFQSAVLRVSTPAFARARHDGESLQESYRKLTVMVASALTVFFPFLAIHAEEIVLTLFGPRWYECVPVVQIAALISMIWAPYMLAPSALTAMGAVGALLRIQLVSAPLALLALMVGAHFDLLTVVWLLTVATIVRLFLTNRAMWSVCGIKGIWVIRQLGSTFAVALAAGTSAFAARFALHSVQTPMFLIICIDGLVVVVVALLTAKAVSHPMYVEAINVLRWTGNLLRKKG